MIGQIFLEIILGALTGYMTNDVAIKGLFKKGGVVETTKEDFIHEASRLLEEEILTKTVISERLQMDSVTAAIDELLKTFFVEKAVKVFENVQLGDLCQYELFMNNLQTVLSSLWFEEGKTLENLILKHFAEDDLLNQQTLRQLSQEVLHIVVQTLTEGNYVEKIFRHWLTSGSDMTWSELGLGPLSEKIADKLQLFLVEFVQLLEEQYADNILQLAIRTLHAIDFEGLLEAVAAELKAKQLSDFLLLTPKEICQYLLTWLDTEEAKGLLTLTANELAYVVLTLKIPLKNLLPMQDATFLLPFLQEQLPLFIKQINEWLAVNQEALNHLIEEAITETFAEEKGLRGDILQAVHDAILQDMLYDYDFVSKIGEFLAENGSQKTAETIVTRLDQWAEKTTIADLANKVERKTLQRSLRSLIKDNLRHFLASEAENIIAIALNTPLERWQPPNMAARLTPKAAEMVCKLLLTEIKERCNVTFLSKYGYRLLDKTVSETLNIQWASQIQQWLTRYLEELSPSISTIEQTKLFSSLLEHGVEQFLSSNWLSQKSQTMPLANLWRMIFEPKRLEKFLPILNQWGQQAVITLLEGNLSRLAENSLLQLSNDEILQLVKDFMGRELKPLNYLGATLGGSVGLILGCTLAGFGTLPTTAQSLALLVGGKSFVFGAVGYGTNCAAIKGLFWPYRPLGNIHALQGVIPKQQERFSHSMGNMVNRYVLNEDIFLQQLNKYQQTIFSAAQKDFLAKQSLWTKVTEQGEPLAVESLLAVQLWTKTHLTVWLSKQGQYSFQQLKDWMPPMATVQRFISEQFIKQLATLAQSTQPFGQRQEQLTTAAINFTDHLTIAWPTIDYRKQALRWNEKFQQWQQQTFAQIIDKEKIPVFIQGIIQKLLRYLASEPFAQRLSEIATQSVSQKPLAELFDGKLNGWIEQNIGWIMQIVYDELLRYLVQKKPELTALVQKQIKNRLSFVQLMGYKLMGGDELAEQVVEKLVENKLPVFLISKRSEMETILWHFWQDHVARFVPAQLQIQPQQLQELFKRLTDDWRVNHLLYHLLLETMTIIEQKPLQGILSKTILHDLPQLYRRMEPEVILANQWLKEHWQVVQRSVIKDAIQTLLPAFATTLTNKTPADLLGDLDESFWQALAWDKLWAMTDETILAQWLADIMTHAAKKPLQEWLDWSATAESLSELVQQLLHDEAFAIWWRESLQRLLTMISADDLPDELYQQMIDYLLDALWMSLIQEGPKILQQMNLAQVTAVQVQAMSPQELEKLVWGFASSYLKHIQNMGWLGAGFALIGIALSWLLW